MARPEIVPVDDEASGLTAFVVIDDTRRGPAFGGIRRRAYSNVDEALADGRRLARAMTEKLSLAELPAGGAKTIVIDRPDLDVAAAYRCLGRAIEGLTGRYVCGPDVGTGARELAAVREATRYVNPVQNDAGAATARGVLSAIRGLCAHRFGTAELHGRTFAIEGLGSVGASLARSLVAAGASVAGHDVLSSARARAVNLGVELEPGSAALWKRACDVIVPCALGDVLSSQLAKHLTASSICGSANNQLVEDNVAGQLHRRGIVWVPDVL